MIIDEEFEMMSSRREVDDCFEPPVTAFTARFISIQTSESSFEGVNSYPVMVCFFIVVRNTIHPRHLDR